MIAIYYLMRIKLRLRGPDDQVVEYIFKISTQESDSGDADKNNHSHLRYYIHINESNELGRWYRMAGGNIFVFPESSNDDIGIDGFEVLEEIKLD